MSRMNRSTPLLAVSFCLIALLAASAPAHAQESAEMEVTFEAVDSCTLSVDDLDFGSQLRTNFVQVAETTITVNCPNLIVYEIGVSAGQNPSGNSRHLANSDGSHELPYSLFQDNSSFPPQWGDTDNWADRKSATGTGSDQEHAVHGVLQVSSEMPLGVYTDTVIVRVYL